MARTAVSIRILLLAVACIVQCGVSLAASPAEDPCATVPHADHPKVVLSNGDARLVLFLPDAQRGYYRASRFDWSGVIACASFHGHSYFGEWFKHYDPLVNDAITGPVEEFRSEDGAIGYAAAAPGGLFVKPGVGVLRKIDNAPYKFGAPYPLVDSGTWKVHTHRRAVSFEQTLHGPDGIAYVYTKVVELDPHGGGISLRHTLRNTGSAAIKTDVYDHDFFMLDGRPTGPGIVVRLPFEPQQQVSKDNVGSAAKFDGKEIVYTQELAPGETFASYINGYSASPSDYNLTVEDRTSGVGVEQTSDAPISRMYLWSIRTTICPEAYIHLDVSPGATRQWLIHYRLFGPSPASPNAGASPAPRPS